ncbi:hypothetical protein [Leptolyngbya sp. FACHB-711]|uniref:hypothetical protein n=1 Tax=unclassified Leptolyngbya TaxID=2650499 RepID=UPI00168937A0|nr:hypothetical protein [Leptolyngbya sp. FACHB-711]MBD1853700.1 hypothetical protein [Cyanobacteria bacterium FACHB-502]MBD2024241.1 hypothetical protein [Leptolyngbya sp. FACHB-711]
MTLPKDGLRELVESRSNESLTISGPENAVMLSSSLLRALVQVRPGGVMRLYKRGALITIQTIPL